MAFIRINRKIFDNFLWKENRVYSRFEAWIDLIQLMCYKKEGDEKIINGVVVRFKRSQYPVSYSFLSQRWNWSIHKVRIFINLLKSEKQASTETTNVTTILTLINYDTYNPISQAEGQAEGQADGKRTAIRKEYIEYKEDFKEEINKEEILEEKRCKEKQDNFNQWLLNTPIEEL